MKNVSHRIRTYFITGLLIVTPIWGTYLVLKTLFVTMEGFLGRFIREYAGGFYVPGLGVLALLGLIFAAGVLTRNIFGRKIVEWWDALVHRVPLVRGVYSTFKSIMDALSSRKKEKFNKVILVEFPRKGLFSLGFVTGMSGGEVQSATQDKVSQEKVFKVYVPTTPNPTSGYLLFVPEKEMTPLSMSVEDGLKVIISGGFFVPPESGKTRAEGALSKRGKSGGDGD